MLTKEQTKKAEAIREKSAPTWCAPIGKGATS